MRELLDLLKPPVLVYPNRDTITDNSRPFLLYDEDSEDGFGAIVEQEQYDISVRPVLFVSCATFHSECHWTPLDFKAANMLGASCSFAAIYEAPRPVISFLTVTSLNYKVADKHPMHGTMVSVFPLRTGTRWNIPREMPTEMPSFFLAYHCPKSRVAVLVAAV